jgi:para-nitrobenzyl esterase
MITREMSIRSGRLRAEFVDGLVCARGVPYGAVVRFRAPQLVPPWDGVRDATKPGPACPQLPSRLDGVTGPVIDGLLQSEDCLVLSVTAPANAERVPVMVWFHGGAYLSGAGESAKYRPDNLVRAGWVVVVNVTYRLGLFGYLTPTSAGEDNIGLRDQLLALQWVRDNISAFGGDPNQVTIFGQSAGGDSVMCLLLAPEADGLFHRAIMQSAPLGLRDSRDRMTAALRAVVDAALGEPANHPGIEQLLAVQSDVVKAADKFGKLGGFPIAPILGLAPLPAADEMPVRLAEIANRVELLIGFTKDDAAAFTALNPTARRLDRLGKPGRIILRHKTSMATDTIFASPAKKLARAWRSYGGTVATFRVDWAPANSALGACHCIELPLLFGSQADWADAPMLAGQPANMALGAEMRGVWAAFAYNGAAGIDRQDLVFG